MYLPQCLNRESPQIKILVQYKWVLDSAYQKVQIFYFSHCLWQLFQLKITCTYYYLLCTIQGTPSHQNK